MSFKNFALVVTLLVLVHSPAAFAQFGGRAGDVVIYAVTANGSGDFQLVAPTITNSPQSVASFRIVPLDSVPISTSEPFPLLRQVLYEQPNELFQVSTDAEGNVGLHRLFAVPTKLFSIEGIINAIGSLLGDPGTFIAFPQGLDVTDDLVVDQLRFINWAPKNWPFLILVDQRGSVGPPDIPGWQYLFQLPNAVKLPTLIPWANMSVLYPGAGWEEGIDLKYLDIDTKLGSTIRLVRLRPGKHTPPFRIAGHTHLFILQGDATISLAGGGTFPMRKYDYAYLPESFTVTLANPVH